MSKYKARLNYQYKEIQLIFTDHVQSISEYEQVWIDSEGVTVSRDDGFTKIYPVGQVKEIRAYHKNQEELYNEKDT